MLNRAGQVELTGPGLPESDSNRHSLGLTTRTSRMNKANPWIVAALMAGMMSLGVWGCSSQKSGAFSAKIREMDARCAKLEEDYRAVATANEKARKKLAELQARNDELARQVE